MTTSGVKRERSEIDFASVPEPFLKGLIGFQDLENNLTLRKVCTAWHNTMSPVFDRNVRWCCDNVGDVHLPLYDNVRFISLDFHQDVSLIPTFVEEVEIFNSEVSVDEVMVMRFPNLEWLRKIVINGGLNYLKELDLSELPHLEHLDLDRFSGKLQLPQATTLKTLITGDAFNEPLDLSGQTALESLEINHYDYQHPLDLENLCALKEVTIPYNFEPMLYRIDGELCIIPLLTFPILFPKAWNEFKIEIIDNSVRFFS